MTTVVLGLLAASLLALLAAAGSPSRGRTHLLLVSASVCFSFAIAEAAAGWLLVRSDSFTFTLPAQLWLKKYWHPINSAGYRDNEWPSSADAQVITFVGDSMVAGAGIDSISDRFADKTAALLGPAWRSVTLAKQGWGPVAELSALAAFPRRSRVIVLSYFINDIIDALDECGRNVSWELEDPPSALTLLFIDDSVLLNALYWREWRVRHADWGRHYWRSLNEAAAEPRCFDAHLAQLAQLIRMAQPKAERTILVAFPNLADVASTREITRKVTEFGSSLGIETIDLGPVAAAWSTGQLIVNDMDSHPSKEFSFAVAKLLAKTITTDDSQASAPTPAVPR